MKRVDLSGRNCLRLLAIMMVALAGVGLCIQSETAGNSGQPAKAAASGSIYDDYRQLQQQCGNMSLADIIVEAESYFRTGDDQAQGALLYRVAISRYSKDLSAEEKECIAIAYSNLGYYWLYEQKNPLEAFPYLLKGLNFLEEVPDDYLTKAAIYSNMASCYALFEEKSKSMEFYRKAFNSSLGNIAEAALPTTGIELMSFAWKHDMLDSIATERRILNKYDTIDTPLMNYARVFSSASESYRQRDYTKAEELLDKALPYLRLEVDNKRLYVLNRILAARAAAGNHDFKHSSMILTQIDSMIQRKDLTDLKIDLYKEWIRVYRGIGDAISVDRLENDILRLRDSLFNINGYGRLRDFESSWAAEEYDSRLAESRERIHRITTYAVILGSAALVICILLLYILRQMKALKESNRWIYQKNVELIGATDTMHRKIEEYESKAKVPAKRNNQNEETQGKMEQNRVIFSVLNEIMLTNEAVFSPDFSLEQLSDISGFRPRVVSEAIKLAGNTNFNSLLAEVRIKEASRRIVESVHDPRRPTIESIGESVGYKSRTHFLRLFKQLTGLTTTQFIKQASLEGKDKV